MSEPLLNNNGLRHSEDQNSSDNRPSDNDWDIYEKKSTSCIVRFISVNRCVQLNIYQKTTLSLAIKNGLLVAAL